MKTKNLLRKAFLLLALVGGINSAWADTENHVADEASAVKYEGTAFDFDKAGASIATNKSTATAADDNDLTFAKGFLPSGSTNKVDAAYTFTAKKDISSLKIYYTMSDSKFTEKDQSKSGNLMYKIDDAEAVTSATTGNKSNKTAYVETISNICEGSEIKLYSSSNRLVIFGVYATYVSATVAPTITTDLPATANVTVGVAQNFSIEATFATSYQWYVGGNAVDGATSASYSYTAATAGNVEIYCNAINSVGTTKSAVCTVTATMPASAPTITTDLQEEYNVMKGSSIELSIVAEDASSYQWYTVLNEPIDGATSSSYTVQALTDIGSYQIFYCAATNAAGTTYSKNAKVTTVGRADCELSNIKFSNGAYGAINSGKYGANTIAVPYMAGTTAPTVNESSIIISEGATYVLDGNTLTVTAEDGTTNKAFAITTVEVTPLSVSADIATAAFSDVPSWIFNLYGYDAEKGVKFAKKVDDASNMRVALGNTRQYYFIGAAKTLTLTSGSAGARNIKVYRNGIELETPTATAAKDKTIDIALDESAPCMIMVESNQTGGDGGFTSYAIAASENVTATIGSHGYATFSSAYALDFTGVDVEAYIATGGDASSVTMEKVEGAVAANTGLVLKGAAKSYSIPVVAEGTSYSGTNKLWAITNGQTVTKAGDGYTNYVLAWQNGAVVFAPVTGDNTAVMPAGRAALCLQNYNSARAINLVFGGITGVEAVEATADAAQKDGKFVINGQLVIKKNGKKYNAAGAQLY